MKKILVILLAITCAFAFISCGSSESVDKFATAIKNTNPEVVTVNITSATALGELSGTYTTTYKADGSFTIEYSYEKFNEIGEGEADELVSTVNGEITCDKDGNYSDGGELTGKTTLATGAKINLGKVSSASVSADGTVLTASVKAANTKAALGVELSSDAELVITMVDGAIVSYTLAYENKSGDVTVVCEYK